MNDPFRLQFTPSMRNRLDYPKFGNEIRMLILGTDYFFDQAWQRAADQLGWKSRTVRSAMVGSLPRNDIEDLFTAIFEFKPDFVLTSNYAGMDTQGIFSRFFEDARIPYVSWFTDTPRMILYDRELYFSDYSVAAVWERAYMRDLNDMGFRHVYYMPLATDPGLFNNAPADAWARQLAFVGKSMSEQALEAWEKLRPFPHIVNAMFDAFDEGRVTRERFAHGIAAILGGELVSTLDRRERRHVELCLIYEATRRQRAAMVLRLDPLGIEVYGDLEWRSVCRRARPTIGYHDGLAPFYRSTAVNVNNTSLQMASAVNQRVFDCPASGGFLITDAQEDLNELFAQDSLVTYSTLDELEEIARHYLNHPEERRSILNRARAEIQARHIHAHRLTALVKYLRAIYR